MRSNRQKQVKLAKTGKNQKNYFLTIVNNEIIGSNCPKWAGRYKNMRKNENIKNMKKW